MEAVCLPRPVRTGGLRPAIDERPTRRLLAVALDISGGRAALARAVERTGLSDASVTLLVCVPRPRRGRVAAGLVAGGVGVLEDAIESTARRLAREILASAAAPDRVAVMTSHDACEDAVRGVLDEARFAHVVLGSSVESRTRRQVDRLSRRLATITSIEVAG